MRPDTQDDEADREAWTGGPTTILVCVVLLMLGVWPGLLRDLAVITFLPVLVALVFVMGWRARGRAGAMPGWPVKTTCAALTFTLLVCHVPQRVAFAACRGSFEALVAEAPEGVFATRIDPRRIGPYTIDGIGKEVDGPGVYIRVRRSLVDLLDTTSYGFAYRPTGDSSPFGGKGYATVPLAGDWYAFEANNDWF